MLNRLFNLSQGFTKKNDNKKLSSFSLRFFFLFSGTLLILMRHFQIREHDTKKDDTNKYRLFIDCY